MNDIIGKIDNLAKKINQIVVFMELCGTHTEAVARHGVKKLLPKNIKLLSGPGCPVCVTDQRDINAVIALALKGIPIACYGDVLRVPGTLKTSYLETPFPSAFGNGVSKDYSISLNKARELGADVTEVYSVEDALKLKEKKPNIVFFGLGFETTTPMTASAIKRGLTVYSSHKAFVPAMAALLATPSLKIDGFINPGHVSTIIGIEPYKKFKLPQVIAGFEADDVIIAIYMLLKQIAKNRAEVENEYTRSVRPEGNLKAMELINEVFEINGAYWRGIGKIPDSGFEIRKEFSKYDAKVKYKNILNSLNTKYPRRTSLRGRQILNTSSGCICGAILRGLKEPRDCKLFNKKCTPVNPVGACMVSSEGACGIEVKFRE